MAKSAKYLVLSFFIICIFFTSGCASSRLPLYIKDVAPYKKSFYGSFDSVLNAATKAMEQTGWGTAKASDPGVFEVNKDIIDPSLKQIVLFSKIRKDSLLGGGGKSHINIYIREGVSGKTEVEIRCLSVTSTPFKNFSDYHQDKVAEKIFDSISINLK